MNMKQLFVGVFLAAVMSLCSVVPIFAQIPFKPAEVISAPDIRYPILSVADGVVVLDVSLDERGASPGTTVVRDIPSLTSAATSSIPSWRFAPASRLGKPESSVIRVAVVFRPRAYLAAEPHFEPIPSNGDPDRKDHGYIPPGILSVAYPQYPVNAVIPGTVVVQVTVSKSGTIGHVKVVRDLPPFTQMALSATNKWRFQAATLDGEPRTSNLAIAFVFAPLLARH
jgi:TonB family protein